MSPAMTTDWFWSILTGLGVAIFVTVIAVIVLALIDRSLKLAVANRKFVGIAFVVSFAVGAMVHATIVKEKTSVERPSATRSIS